MTKKIRIGKVFSNWNGNGGKNFFECNDHIYSCISSQIVDALKILYEENKKYEYEMIIFRSKLETWFLELHFRMRKKRIQNEISKMSHPI